MAAGLPSLCGCMTAFKVVGRCCHHVSWMASRFIPTSRSVRRPQPITASTSENMTGDILTELPARPGHFLLESGYHTDLWLTLDAVFVDPTKVAPLVATLADRLQPYAVTAVCGPVLGGAFLAQAVASTLGARFYYSEPSPASPNPGLFKAEYRLPPELSRRVRGERVAVVDDVISAGSSVRATIEALTVAGASTVAIGAFVVLGETAVAHFATQQVSVETLARRDFNLWKPVDCPLCRAGHRLEDPRGPLWPPHQSGHPASIGDA
jgi:orotate phosphoribosyltransferase